MLLQLKLNLNLNLKYEEVIGMITSFLLCNCKFIMINQKDLEILLSKRATTFTITYIKDNLLAENLNIDILFNLLFDSNESVTSYNSAWIMTHLPKEYDKYLEDKTELLIDELIRTQHVGKRRHILNIIYKLKLGLDPISVRLLNFCFEKMISQIESSGVRSLCVKIGYALSQQSLELVYEFKQLLKEMENENSPAIRSVVTKTLNVK